MDCRFAIVNLRLKDFAVVTQSAECQSSKLETWVRTPLTAFLQIAN